MTTIFPQYEVCVKKWLIPVTHLSIIRRLSNNPKLRRFMTRLAILLRSALLILTLVCVSQTMARSQKYKVTIKAKEQRLLDVFKTIQKQTNLIVFYSNTILNDQEKVSIQVKDEALEKVLDQIVAGKALQYEVQEKYIVISPKEIKKQTTKEEGVVSAEDVPAPPPTIDVSGRITDEDGNPLLGASIMIKGTKTGTQTNADGYFILKGVDEKAVLEISYVGFEKREMSAGGMKAIQTLALKRKDSPLDAIQIEAYRTNSRRLSTGNIQTINKEQISRQPVTNPLLAMQARIPGVEITQTTGMNNGYIKVRIQGQNGIVDNTGRNDPLIVVDGVPYPSYQGGDRVAAPLAGNTTLIGASPLSFINPADIESISVLKDADATSIYGSRGSNGVILITTKKGVAGKPKVDIRLQQGVGQVTRRLDLMNTRQYLDMRYEALRNDGLSISPARDIDLTLWDTTRNTDWQKTLIGGSAQYTMANATLSGGNSLANYLIGGTFNRTTDVFPGDYANQSGTLHFSIGTASTNQRFRLQLGGSYMGNVNTLPSVDLTDAALSLEPNAPALYNSDGSLNWAVNSSGSSTWENPLRHTLRDIKYTTNNFLSNASVSYLMLPGLNLKSTFGYNLLNSSGYRKIPLAYNSPESQPNSVRQADLTRNATSNWIVEPQLTYETRIKDLRIEALLGSTLQRRKNESLGFTGKGYTSDLLMDAIGSGTSLEGGAGWTEYRYASLFSRLNMNYSNKYIVNINFRRDASSRFGAANKVHSFSSIGGAWIFSDDRWVKDVIPFLSFGKLRVSYGTTGSDAISDYAYLSTYSNVSSSVPYQGVVGLNSSGISNPYLQWQATEKLSIGSDLGFFDDRILVGASFNRNICSNQLLSQQLPTITGASGMLVNRPARVRNVSWEFTISSVNIRKPGFEWTSNINLTIPRNKLLAYPDIDKSPYAAGTTGVIVGQPLGILKTLRYYGLDPQTGIPLIYDVNGNPTATPNYSVDNTALVDLSPRFMGGVNNSLSYKGWQLDFFFQFVRQKGPSDKYYYNRTSPPGRFVAGRSNQTLNALNRWQQPGDQTDLVMFSTNSSYYSVAASSDVLYTYAASFIRLKNLALSWEIPSKLIQRSGLRSAHLNFQAQNLLTISGFTGLDPETGAGNALPPLRVLTIGIQLGF